MVCGASVCQYIGALMSPSANRQCWPDTVRQYFLFWCLERHYLAQGTSVRH
jgi:hypothetical protein